MFFNGDIMKHVGLIGFGNFGRYLYGLMCEYFKFYIYDRSITSSQEFSTLEECLSKDIIILAIPAGRLENFLIENAVLFNKNSRVFDVSSVKMKPLKLLEHYLPSTIEIVGTHPLFGPNSGIKNSKIVICPVRSSRLGETTSFLKDKLGLEVLIRTPEEHDREMAIVQGLTHFIARALKKMNLKDCDMKTKAYEHLLGMYDILKKDTDDLFHTIEHENPFAGEIRRNFMGELEKINKDI